MSQKLVMLLKDSHLKFDMHYEDPLSRPLRVSEPNLRGMAS